MIFFKQKYAEYAKVRKSTQSTQRQKKKLRCFPRCFKKKPPSFYHLLKPSSHTIPRNNKFLDPCSILYHRIYQTYHIFTPFNHKQQSKEENY
ncbi:hypothetical protein RhiirA4_187423 [Rhizophagus irregularis]|uniref:Uncharacterized protein n=1 Tax=Rhizophagus irregularis TaxID=588596 RepID=A0A2I1FX67_9GLOM|nr:hypothetical protein RhiirA4_187423 [Rhizophagus irregularis]